MNPMLKPLALLSLVAGAIFFTHLGSVRLWDRDEPRNAGCAREMLQRGDLVVPMFNDELRRQKPVLLYWLMAVAYQVFGDNEFAARFWSAVAGLGTVWITYGIARRLFDSQVAWLSGIILATSLMFVVASRAATPDSLLIFCSALAVGLYVRATFQQPTRGQPSDPAVPNSPESSPAEEERVCEWFPRDPVLISSIYAAMAVGVLAKGPVGVVVPMAVIGMFMLVMRLPRREARSSRTPSSLSGRLLQVSRDWLRPFHPVHFIRTLKAMRPHYAIAMVLMIAGPWYLAVGLHTNGDWPRQFFLTENVGRATSSFENHSGGIWYYPVALLMGFFPWSLFAVPVVIGLYRATRVGEAGRRWPVPEVTLLLCWIGVQVGLFSLASTKLPSYVTPCYPALAILVASALTQLARKPSICPTSWLYASAASFIVGGVALAVGLNYVAERYLPGEYHLAWLGLIPGVTGILIAGLLWFHRRRPQLGRARLTYAAAAGAIIFAIAMFGLAPVAVDRHQHNHVFLNRIGSSAGDQVVAAYGCLESSWIYYGQRPIFELISSKKHRSRGDSQYASVRSVGRDHFWEPKPRYTPQQFIDEFGRGHLITIASRFDELQNQVGVPLQIINRSKYFLKDREILLLGFEADAIPADWTQRTAPAEVGQQGESLLR